VAELLGEFEENIEALTLVPSSGGVFEVSVNGRLLYSKRKTGRHAEPGEVVEQVRNFLKEGK
jgi:selenoprotein W-related protein